MMARLIDADALKWKLIHVKLYVHGLRFGKTVLGKILESYRRAVFEEIEEAPTIDPEELRPKGEWKRVEDSECYWYECSECGEPPLKHYKYDCLSNYCPNCGLKMEGVDG